MLVEVGAAEDSDEDEDEDEEDEAPAAGTAFGATTHLPPPSAIPEPFVVPALSDPNSYSGWPPKVTCVPPSGRITVLKSAALRPVPETAVPSTGGQIEAQVPVHWMFVAVSTVL